MKDFHQLFAISTDTTVYSDPMDFSGLDVAPSLGIILNVSPYVAGNVTVVVQVASDKDDPNSFVDLSSVDNQYSDPSAYSSSGKRGLRIPNGFWYYRLKITSAGGANMTLDVKAFPRATGGAVSVSGNLADGQTNTENPLLMGAEAQDPTALPTPTTAGKIVRLLATLSRILLVSLADRIAGEDLDEDVMKVEQRFTRGRATADSLIVSGPGLIHTITISPLTATPTAGLLTIYDSTTEGSTVIHSEWVPATAVSRTLIFDHPFGVGLYVGFDATLANVGVELSYRS